ncbi:MAG: VWA domain-containing protein [Firmicutes bacterium]|nr:VWA domain-containing protein [Bacillota bacterium]
MQEHTHTKACYADPAHKTKESAEKTFCRLTSDDAKICELNANDNTTIYDQENKQRQTAAVRNGDLIKFGFSLKMESYSGTVYDEGRIRFEFVLPLSSEKVAFDLTSMEWLDRSDGFEPVVRNEERSMNGKKTSCQVLTGYALLSSEKVEESIIPGEFAETVSVSVLNLKAGEKVWVQIGAAMETNTWDKTCKEHLAEERLTAETGILTAAEAVSAEKQDAEYNDYLEKIEKLENSEKSDVKTEAEALLQSMRESYQQGLLSDEGYAALCDKAYVLAYGDVTSVAEPAEGSNWILLRDSGWFELYDDDVDEVSAYSTRSASNLQAKQRSSDQTSSDVQNPSGIQVNNTGGTNTSEDGSVSVSKTISGTELENVFDITLKVQTALDVAEIREEPDMAVVIVMDISNTMNSNFGGVTRYAAAMESAENFLDQFAENNSLGISKVGYVAFNTDAHQIFGLQSCSTEAKANELKNTMRTQTGSIINASGYNEAHSRFTNVEAGLAMAADMLNGVSNKNKYIIFLSDGFPTTYIESGYSGYDPYDSTGRFYDHVLNKPCRYGTSYSDEAAIRARKKAATIKNSGIDIFSIGVDVAGQTIQKYITQSENASDYSVVDRTGTTYEVGDASSTEAYKNWLRNSIGSGYYYDSTDADGLKAAYNQIFEEIKHQVEAGSVADWVTSDPIPTVSGVPGTVEFIGFYNKTLELISGNLSGNWSKDGENTAVYQADEAKINWNLKNSGFTIATVGGTTQYTYQLVYRVRLKNENLIFNEGTSYPTNDTTTLQYRNIEVIDENQKVSDPKTVEFPIPSVHGYLSELTFQKVDSSGNPVSGAEFTLRHDDRNCSICKGNGESVSVPEQTNTSNAEGQVKFSRIPSGHKYVLEETRVPDGYSKTGNSYEVEVAYDHITVTVKDYNGNPIEWDSKIVNNSYYELPSTGGIGTGMFMIGGLLLITVAGILLIYNQKKRRKEEQNLS